MIRNILNSLGQVVGTLILPDNTPEAVWTEKLKEYLASPEIKGAPLYIGPQEVITQGEKVDRTSKMFSALKVFAAEDTIPFTLLIKVPGTIGPNLGRWIQGFQMFFDTAQAGDRIVSIRVTDEDNLLGFGAGFVVKSLVDDVAPVGNQGVFIPPIDGMIQAQPSGGSAFIPSGMYFKILAQKATPAAGIFFANIRWSI